MTRHELARDDGVISCDHASGEVFSDGLSVEVQVTKHFIRTPSSKELNDVSIDIRKQKSHSTSRSEGAG